MDVETLTTAMYSNFRIDEINLDDQPVQEPNCRIPEEEIPNDDSLHDMITDENDRAADVDPFGDEESTDEAAVSSGHEVRKSIREAYKDEESLALFRGLTADGGSFFPPSREKESSTTASAKISWIVSGQETYLQTIRPLFEKNPKEKEDSKVAIFTPLSKKKLSTATPEKKKGRPGKPGAGGKSRGGKEKIIAAKKSEDIFREAQEVITDYNTYTDEDNRTLNPVFSLRPRRPIVEIAIIRFILNAQVTIENFKDTLNTLNSIRKDRRHRKCELDEAQREYDQLEREMYEIILGARKLYRGFSAHPDLSEDNQSLRDLSSFIQSISETVSFSPSRVTTQYPDLIYRTKFDKIIKGSKKYSLNTMQREVIETIAAHSGSGDSFLGLLFSGLGTGKTSLALGVAGYLNTQCRSVGKDGFVDNVLFVVPTAPVLYDVVAMLWRAGVNCSIVARDSKVRGNYKAYDAKKGSPCHIFLTDFHVAQMVLKTQVRARLGLHYSSENLNISMMIVDEPTIGADTPGSIYTRLFVEIMALAPAKTILMSGTMPRYEEMPELYDSFLERHRRDGKNPSVVNFRSIQPKIGCQLLRSDGSLYLPHLQAQNTGELERILNCIRVKPMVGRLYTFDSLRHLVDQAAQMGIIAESLDSMLDDPDQASQQNILRRCLTILEEMSKIPGVWLSWSASKMPRFAPETIFRNNYDQIASGTLVFTSSPIDTAFSWYEKNYGEGFLDKAPNIMRLMTRYRTSIAIWKSKCESINRAATSSGDSLMSKSEREGASLTSLAGTGSLPELPRWEFDSKYCLGTSAHQSANKYNFSSCRGIPIPPELIQGTVETIDNRLLYLLFCGIGVYTESRHTTREYLNLVVSGMNSGYIKIIFCDGGLAYGLNLPVGTIVLNDERIVSKIDPGTEYPSIIDQHSIKTIFQMLGRAGRGGNLSYRADAYMIGSDRLATMLDRYLVGTLQEGIRDEAANIMARYRRRLQG